MGDRIYNNILLVGISAVLIFSPIAGGSVGVWAATPVLLTMYALISIWLFKLNNRSINKIGYSPLRKQPPILLNAAIVLFSVLAVVSFIFSIYKHDSFFALLRLFAYVGLYCLIVSEFDHIMLKRLIWIAIFVGGGLSIFGILQYLGVFDRSWWIPREFLASTYTNHNHFAGYLELVMPVASAILIAKSGESRTINKLMLVMALVFMFTAFILTQSRGAWICLGTATLAAILFLGNKGIKTPKKLFISVLLVMSIASLIYLNRDTVSSRLGTIDSADDIENSMDTRIKIWSGAMGMIYDRPLVGVGIGDFDYGFNRFKPEGLSVRAVYAHNDYLQAAAEMGILAPLLMICIFVVAVMAGLKNHSNPYALGCAIGVLSLSLHAMVDFNFHIPANMVLFTVWLGIIMKESDAKRT